MYSNWALRSGWLVAFVGFPVDLPRETDLGEQLAHAVGADRVAHGDKRAQLVEALRHPQQRADRIAQRRRLDEALEIRAASRHVRSMVVGRRLHGEPARGKGGASRSFSPRSMVLRASPVISRPRPDHPSGGARLARGKQPSTALVPLRTVRFPPLPNRVRIDHADPGRGSNRPRKSKSRESRRRIAELAIRFTYCCRCPK